jgi:electron transfer flavoprotein-quinone oxidoreductase
MSDFDAVIVGAGCAGLAAAYKLASNDVSVLVVERGNFAGSKNMTGGRLYSHSLEKLLPGFADEAPVERKITHERISLMTSDGNFTVDYTSPKLGETGKDSYSVLRATFDQWLAKKAEEAGAEIIYGVRVDDLIVRDGTVCGIRAGEDEIEAEVTIIAEGVNSLLAQKIGYLTPPTPHQMAVGVKALYALPAQTVADRFQCSDDEGAAWLFIGDATKGHVGGGFLYTNKESLSIGLVATLSDLVRSQTPVYQMLEDFVNHDAIVPVLRGGTLLEYSGHLIPEGGFKMIPRLVGNGVLLCGDAAMLCMNLGYAVRGMDFALSSGDFAAQATIEALSKGDTSEASLKSYKDLLESSYVLKDLKAFQGFPHFMEDTTRLFNEYPKLVQDIMLGLFTVDGSPTVPVKKKVTEPLKEIGVITVFKDVMKGGKVL